MREKTTDLIYKDGFKPLIIIALIFFLFLILDLEFLVLLSFISLALTFIFFINPEREPEEEDALAVISPVDGKITNIESSGEGVTLTINNFILDPHLIRSPFDTVLKSVEFRGGTSLFLSNKEARRLNKSASLTFEKEGELFTLFLLNSYINFTTRVLFSSGDTIRANKRVGFFPSGEATFQCPKNVDLKVSIGDNLKAGESLLGFITK